MNPRVYGWLLLLFSSLTLQAAEPIVDVADLPRVPPTPPDQALQTIRVKAGFRVDLVAAEPLVVDPIAMSFDEQGRLFVVEMRDYSERRPERLGRIKMLVDTNVDGLFDTATVYVEDLPWPTAVCCYEGGVFVGATPDILFCKDTNGDGRADTRTVVFTGFASDYAPYQTNRLNVQALLNSLNWGLDNRIHGSASLSGGKVTCPSQPERPALDLRGHDFSFDPRTYDLRTESGGGQHGLSFNNAGRKFICSNSSHCRLVTYEDRYSALNPAHPLAASSISIAADGDAAPVYRISPDEPWRVIRTKWRVAGLVPGPVEGGGRPSGYFTGATGITIYRGSAFPNEYQDDIFVADCGSNLIHHKKVREEGAMLVAYRAEDEATNEFLASTDNWFRPVQLANGPDGALYVADMYREVIEHPWSLPASIKEHLDLNSGNDRGRIYRIVPSAFKQPARPRLGDLPTRQLVEQLADANGWHRDTAARLLYQRQDRSAQGPLEELLRNGSTPWARLQALYALDGLKLLQAEHIALAQKDADQQVRCHAVRLAEKIPSSPLDAARLANDPSARVRYQLAFTLGLVRPTNLIDSLQQVANASAEDTWVRMATIHAAGVHPINFLLSLARNSAFVARRGANAWMIELAGAVGGDDSSSQALLEKLDEPALRLALPNLVSGLGEGLKRRGKSLTKIDTEHILDSLFLEASQRAKSEDLDDTQRASAVRLLGFAQSDSSRETFRQLLKGSGALDAEVLQALSRDPNTEVAPMILQAWPRFTPPTRALAIDALLVRTERIKALLDAMANGTVRSSELDPRQQQALRNHPDKESRERAQALLTTAPIPEREKVVAAFEPALRLTGYAEAGHKIFSQRCTSCHRIGEEGHPLGPDLTSVRSAGWPKLLTQILDPNREVAPSYISYTIETRDGEAYSGVIAQESGSSVTLRQANGVETNVSRSNISRLHSEGLSLMPIGLETGLTPADLADLLQFIAPR